jgi:hypothetical protein
MPMQAASESVTYACQITGMICVTALVVAVTALLLRCFVLALATPWTAARRPAATRVDVAGRGVSTADQGRDGSPAIGAPWLAKS